MDLDCLNTIIKENLAIHIDLTNSESWDLNTGLTLNSMTKWKNAISDDLSLYDFGLTAFDNGRVDELYDSLTLTQNDNKLKLLRVGYNDSGDTYYSGYTITAITGASVGRYFSLDGGYLQGFFKLYDYSYEIFPPRYNNGITFETIIELLPQSEGTFLCIGTRAEDKYNKYFSGETTLISSSSVFYGGDKNGELNYFDGVVTSEDNFFISEKDKEVKLSAFKEPEYADVLISDSVEQLINISNNIISFGITDEKKIIYKYINENGSIIQNESPNPIDRVGWTVIDIIYKPYDTIVDYDPSNYLCYDRRKGDLIIYINGRKFWKIDNFDEFYFKNITNDREKQLGVPFNISWGGGSFGLEHSWHYDTEEYPIYISGDTNYINTNFTVEGDPNDPNLIGTPVNGLQLSADNTTFSSTVMRIEYTGVTGTSVNKYLVLYNQPITALSNRDYIIDMSIYDGNIFGFGASGKTSIFTYGTVDIDVVEYIDYATSDITGNNTVNGSGKWINLKSVIRTEDNSQQQTIYIGLLIESSDILNLNVPFFIDNFKYTAADVLAQDSRKDNLTIEKYFNSSFIGNIQKLRIYDNALSAREVLHNTLIETRYNSSYGIAVSKGGRIIQRYQNVPYIPQEVAGSDIRKSISYRNADGTFKDLYQMIDIKVVVKSRTNPSVELVKFKKIAETGWLQLIWVNDITYDFIVPDTITAEHPHEILFVEILFQWSDPLDIDNVFDRIFITDITTSSLLDSTVKNY